MFWWLPVVLYREINKAADVVRLICSLSYQVSQCNFLSPETVVPKVEYIDFLVSVKQSYGEHENTILIFATRHQL